jgi:predicted deacylase
MEAEFEAVGPELEADEHPVPTQVERGGLLWNLINRGGGVWGIQQGLSHQGVLEHSVTSEPASWRVTTSAISYTAPDEGFSTWSEAMSDFLAEAGSDAVDVDD